MFIAHGEKFRKNAKWMFGAFAIVTSLSLIGYFSQTGGLGDSDKKGDLPTVRGKPLNAAEFQRARNAVLAQYVMRSGRLPDTAQANDEVTQQAVIRLLLLRQAKDLNLRVSDSDLVAQMQSMPMFRAENGAFDPDRYRRYTIQLNHYGINEAQFEDVMREEIIISRLQNLITATAKVPPGEVLLAYTPLHERIGIALVEFDATNQQAAVVITTDDAKAFYEKNKEQFRTPKQVKVRYARFDLAPAKAAVKVTDEEVKTFWEKNKAKYTDADKKPMVFEAVKNFVRDDLVKLRAIRVTGDRATDFSVKLVSQPGAARPDFAALASAAGATLGETDYIGPRETPAGIKVGGQFNQAAFALDAKDSPFSDPVLGDDSFYVLEILGNKPSAIPSFEEVQPQVLELLQKQRHYEITVKQGQDAAARVKLAVASGKTFEEACADLSLKPQVLPPFSLSDPNKTLPAVQRIEEMALGMATNAVSEFVQTPQGGVFFQLQQRLPPDAQDMGTNTVAFANQILQSNRQAIWQDWVGSLIRREQVTFGRPRSRPAHPAGETEDDTAPDAKAPPAKS